MFFLGAGLPTVSKTHAEIFPVIVFYITLSISSLTLQHSLSRVGQKGLSCSTDLKSPAVGSRGTVNMTGPPQLLLFGIPPWQVDGWPHLDACSAGLRAELLSLMHRVFPIALILCAVSVDLQHSWARTGRRDHQKASETHAHSDTTKLKGLSVPIPRARTANWKAWNRKETERAIRIPRGWNITGLRNQREESSAMQAISSWAI